MDKHAVTNALVWSGFAFALLLATAPVWQRAAYGFNPTLDDVLRVALCKRDLLGSAPRTTATGGIRFSCVLGADRVGRVHLG